VTALPDPFSSPPASASGDGFVFALLGTTLPGTDGGGLVNAYRATRGANGWSSSLIGPGGQQATAASPGGFSADQTFQSFVVGHFDNRNSGILDLGGREGTGYIRYPDGSFRLPGEGTLTAYPDDDGNPNGFADELRPTINWISPLGGHIIFSQRSDVRLLPDSPPAGVPAVYDRTEQGLRLVSLLPDGSTPSGPSTFEGASADGSTILFRTAGALYARVGDRTTIAVATGEVLAAGASADGQRIFYVEGSEGGGDLFMLDLGTGLKTQINTSGDARFVNLAADGSHVYFESPSVLDSEGSAVPGSDESPRLYVWDGSSIEFIATVTELDLARKPATVADPGLTQWVRPAGAEAPARNSGFLSETSRTNSSGTVFAFESTADPLGKSPGGKVEIYRFATGNRELSCVSCGETGSAGGDSTFADYSFATVGMSSVIPNLSEDGKTIFFQTAAPLVAADSNGQPDVYEWREGQVSLISTGRSSQPSLLMGATPSGEDVFFRTGEQLVPHGQEPGVPAVYDARVNGGFGASPQAGPPCPLETCQGEPPNGDVPPPPPGSSLLVGPGHCRRHRATNSRKSRGRHRHHQRRCGRKHRHPSHRDQSKPR